MSLAGIEQAISVFRDELEAAGAEPSDVACALTACLCVEIHKQAKIDRRIAIVWVDEIKNQMQQALDGEWNDETSEA